MKKRYQKAIMRMTEEGGASAIVLEAEPMDRHCTFRAGGTADLYVCVNNHSQLFPLVKSLHDDNIPYVVVGRGSNLLVSDKGYGGVIVNPCGNSFRGIEIKKEQMIAGAAVLLAEAAEHACQAGLSGLEELAGIPGTIGGALAMNAGAYGREMKDIVKKVRAFDPSMEETDEGIPLLHLKNKEMHFSYRHSVAKEYPLVLMEATLQLKKDEPESIRERMRNYAEQRREKQPLEYPSAGSTFKRPEGHFAGKLIEEAGLRGFTIGGAQVSEKHCGFIVNKGGATATDILTLMREVRRRVSEYSGVSLEPEVMILGEEL